MRRKTITCDICGEDITDNRFGYMFKGYEYDDDFLDFMNWHSKDMCRSCYEKFKKWVKDNEVSSNE